MTAMRLPIVIASTWSCVTYMVVIPRRACSWISSSRVWMRSCASRFESGSSIRNACGSRTMARASATRWRCPPESCPGRRSSSSSRPRMPAARVIAALISAFGFLAISSGNAMFFATVMCG